MPVVIGTSPGGYNGSAAPVRLVTGGNPIHCGGTPAVEAADIDWAKHVIL